MGHLNNRPVTAMTVTLFLCWHRNSRSFKIGNGFQEQTGQFIYLNSSQGRHTNRSETQIRHCILSLSLIPFSYPAPSILIWLQRLFQCTPTQSLRFTLTYFATDVMALPQPRLAILVWDVSWVQSDNNLGLLNQNPFSITVAKFIRFVCLDVWMSKIF